MLLNIPSTFIPQSPDIRRFPEGSMYFFPLDPIGKSTMTCGLFTVTTVLLQKHALLSGFGLSASWVSMVLGTGASFPRRPMEQWWQLRFCVSLTPNLTDRPTTWRELGCGPGPLASHPEDWTLETFALEVSLSGHHTRHELGLAASTVDIVPLDVEGSMIQSALLSFPVRSPQWSNVRSPGADVGAWFSSF